MAVSSRETPEEASHLPKSIASRAESPMSLLLVRPLTPPCTYIHTLSQLDTAIKLKGFVNSGCQLPNGFCLRTKHNCFLSSIILSSRHSSMLVYEVYDFWLMAFLIHFRFSVLVFCSLNFQPCALIWNLRSQAQCLSLGIFEFGFYRPFDSWFRILSVLECSTLPTFNQHKK